MAPIDNESQFKFLIACIKHSTAGKPDFGKVAQELEIVSKGAAAKRYERLMKAHGVSNTGTSASPAPSGPSIPTTPKTPKTPGGRKNLASGRTSSNKKRKLAERGNDIDDDIKPEIKDELKQEVKHEATYALDGSYMINPSNPPFEAAATATLLTTPGDAYGGGNGGGNDDVLLVSETRGELGGPSATVAFAQQMLMPFPENSYGFIDPATQLHHSSQPAMLATGTPIGHGFEANYPSQTMLTSSPELGGGHWLHHHDPVLFWSGEARLETGNIHQN